MQTSSRTAENRSDTIQIGRQAILDRELNVFAYELLYRDADGRCNISDGDHATSVTLLNAFMEIGLERITGPHKAFINLTRRFFVDLPPIPFPANRVVLEVLEDVAVDDALIAGVSKMSADGFELAMDDYAFQREFDDILPLVNYIKVEISDGIIPELKRRLPELRATGAKLLAEKVETAEQFEQLKAMGFDYFQGYFFARPDLVKSDRLKENAAMVIQLLARLNDPSVPMDEVVRLVSQDPALSYKVLRFINSAAVGLRAKVDSIQRAVVLMGLQRIRAWATLFALAGLDNKPMEILNIGLLRANLCENLAKLCSIGEPDAAYTVGLLSVVDAMLGQPMDELMAELPLPAETKDAITLHDGPHGKLLRLAIQMERNEWAGEQCSDVPLADLMEAYAESTDAAFKMLEIIKD